MNLLECGVCNELFDDRKRRPRILPCSHSFCSCCLSQLIDVKNKTCPLCRADFEATTAEDLLFNRYVLDIAKHLAGQGTSCKQDDKAEVTCGSWQKDFIAFTEKKLAEYRKTKTALQGDIRGNEALEDALLQINKEMISSMMKQLRHQGRQNKTLIKTLRENSLQLQEEYGSLVEEVNELEDASDKLVNATGFASVGFAMEKINQICNAGDERSKTENDLILTNEQNANTIMKMQYKIEELTCIFQNTLKEKEDNAVYITVSNLLRMNNLLKRTIEQGRLLAFQDRDEIRRYGRIRLESGNKICLSHLREEEKLPPEVHLIKHDHIMELLNSRPYQTFVELGTSDASIGRMVIKLDREGHYSKNFLLMCAGTVGPSYVGMKMNWVVDQSKQGERVGIGSVQTDKVAISGIDWDKEARKKVYHRTQCKAGLVKAWNHADIFRCSIFVVYTKDNISSSSYGCFGMVEEGLDALTNAISQYANITRIKVVNSGIIVSL